MLERAAEAAACSSGGETVGAGGARSVKDVAIAIWREQGAVYAGHADCLPPALAAQPSVMPLPRSAAFRLLTARCAVRNNPPACTPPPRLPAHTQTRLHTHAPKTELPHPTFDGVRAAVPTTRVRGVVLNTGVRGFFRGWTAAYSRAGPAYFIQMPIVEKLREVFGLDNI